MELDDGAVWRQELVLPHLIVSFHRVRYRGDFE